MTTADALKKWDEIMTTRNVPTVPEFVPCPKVEALNVICETLPNVLASLVTIGVKHIDDLTIADLKLLLSMTKV